MLGSTHITLYEYYIFENQWKVKQITKKFVILAEVMEGVTVLHSLKFIEAYLS